jgi:hypothetical protein
VQACTSASAVNYGRRVPIVIVEASGDLYFVFCIPFVINTYVIARYQRLLLQRVTSGLFRMTYSFRRLWWCLYRPYYEYRIYVQILGLCRYCILLHYFYGFVYFLICTSLDQRWCYFFCFPLYGTFFHRAN